MSSFTSGASAVRRPTLDVERKLWREGHRWVAGIDEVGRGAWAGPLSVGVAVVHAGTRASSMPVWLRDSKTIPEERREGAFVEIARWCADAAVGHASAQECDRWGMTLAWRLAAHRALCALEIAPDALLIDGPHDLLRGRPAAFAPGECADAAPGEQRAETSGILQATCTPGGRGTPELPGAHVPSTILTIVGGDARCAALSAASVLAKVVRDRLMRDDAVHFPPYSFERNKGYPSPRHQMALRGYGLSAIHRRTWAYVEDLPWR
jgi:ribonuclease HII